MNDLSYLKRQFKEYYKENQKKVPIVNSFEKREFGFIPWDQQIRMIRHIGYSKHEQFLIQLSNNGPRHIYASGSLYLKPEIQNMENKDFQGCDFIVDIDVDHFYTPCKEDHDFWYCKECGKNGKGMVEKCPDCGKSKLKKLTWICEKCLNIAKKEITKMNDFLLNDFNIDIGKIKIAFSGHRGYHLKAEDKALRSLSSDERREIVDYLTGENISFEILGLREIGGNVFGLSKQTIGWPRKIIRKIEEILDMPNLAIESLLSDKSVFNLPRHFIENLINSKDQLLKTIREDKNNNWTLVSSNINLWYKFLEALVKEIGIKLDAPVSIDIHRLIRYPGSLHGSTGFKVQELLFDELDLFNPLDEQIEKLDPIVFMSKVKTIQKIEITEPIVPLTKIKGETFGPYKSGEKIEVPHHIAIFLLCKGVAKSI
ncbi:MAG: DNA primase small subunit domain-containing protein [Candidatus Hermodarchaeota archaeon]